MTTIDTVVIGAGHAGLAVSRLLTEAGRDHVVLDRGRVGERWRTERWDSLHLLSPNWMTRLPGWHYNGPDPEGYLSASQFVRYLEGYAASFRAPVVGGATVTELAQAAESGHRRYRVGTGRGSWHARHVVIATGPYGTPRVPYGLERVRVVTANQYRNARQLAEGGVLVVGASASGVQIADELVDGGREVTLAVGRHTRMPRRYRGVDIFRWLERTGRLARTIDEVSDPTAARGEPSLQLVGRNDPQRPPNLDLGTLQTRGVRLVGRLDGITARTATFRHDLHESVAAADRAMHSLLDSIDRYAEQAGVARTSGAAARPRPVVLSDPPTRLDLRAESIGTVLLATGYRPLHPWLRLPITAPDGSLRQHRGVTPMPGVYTVGQRFQHRRDSSFIDGARHDARIVVNHLLSGESRPARVLVEEPAA